MVAEPETATLEGLKLAVAPAGKPVALKVTVSLKPPIGFRLMPKVVLVPGEASLKPGLTAT